MKNLLKLSLAAAAVVTAFGVQAQEFPSKDKTITLVVPYAAGGPTDRVARDLAEALRGPLGATVVVTGGIHVDAIQPGEIRTVLHLVDRLTLALVDLLTADRKTP